MPQPPLSYNFRVSIIIIAHNIRSCFNIGSIFRIADGFGVDKIILSGYSPYPKTPNDKRLPHIASKMTSSIHKTALGAENSVAFEHHEAPPIDELKRQGYVIAALEQTADSINLSSYKTPPKIALILGEEVNGVPNILLDQCDIKLEIPMLGKKESFNVSSAAAIALYQLVIIGV